MPKQDNVLIRFLRWLIQLLTEDTNKEPRTGKTTVESPPPYQARSTFMTPTESAFDKVLCSCINDPNIRIHRKVRIADILQVPPGSPRWQHWFNRISSKHVDFLICLEQRPIGVIELNDSSHKKQNRQLRDDFINTAYASASLPLLMIPAARSYDTNMIKEFIYDAVRNHSQAGSGPH